MAKKESVLIWLNYARNKMERAIKAQENELIKEIYRAELANLDEYIKELK